MAIKFLSGLNLSGITTGSLLKLDANGDIVAAVAGTDYATSSSAVWSTSGSNPTTAYYNGRVRVGTYQASVEASAKLHVFEYQTTDPKLLIEDGNTGDASMQFKISTQSYVMGIDNSDNDLFKISGTAFGTNDIIKISNAGALDVYGQNVTFYSGAANNSLKVGRNGNEYLQMYVADRYSGLIYTQDESTGAHEFYFSIHSNTVDEKYFTWNRHLADGSGGGEWMRLSEGNLGIGTTSPSYKLQVDVNSASTGTDSITVANRGVTSNGHTVGIRFRYNTAEPAAIRSVLTNYINGASRLGFFTSSDGTGANIAERMGITADGNVGIGTTSPSQKLHIDGGNFLINGQIIKQGGGSLLRLYVPTWTNADTHDVLYNGWNASLGDYNYLRASGNSTGAHGAIIVGDNGFYVGRTNVETGNIADSTTDPLDNDVWFYATGAKFQINDRLYIGTVDANTTSTSALVLGTSNEVEQRTLGSNAFTSTSYLPTTGGTVANGNTAIPLTISRTSATSLQVGVRFLATDGASEPTDQYFGAGTDAEPYWSTTANLSTGSMIWHEGNDGAGSGLDADTLDGYHASSFLTAEADTLDSVTGRGATTTNAITTSTHTISNGYLILSGASSSVNPEIEFTDDSGFGVAGYKLRYGNADGWTFYDSYWASGGGHRFRTGIASSTIEALTITHTGNVGIGTTSPGGVFDVQKSSSGNILARVWNTNTAGTGSSSIRIANSGNNNNGSRLEFSDSSYYVATISGDRTQGLVFRTSATGSSPTGISEWMRITPTGNVGINTSSPAYKLDVASTARFADGIRIESKSGVGNWRIYKNVWDYAYDGNQSGSVIINTNIPRNCNEMLMIHVMGYGYGDSTIIDFKVVVYPYSGTTGQDSVSGAPTQLRLIDSGNDGKPKFIGINSSGKIAIAFADYDDGNKYFYRYTADYHAARYGTDSYAVGWTTENNSTSGFSWLHKETLSSPYTIMPSGYFGIGTSNPSGSLHLEGNFESTKALVIKGTYGTDTEYYFRTHGVNSEYLALYAGGSRVMNWTSSGLHTYKGLHILGGDITTDTNNALTLGSSIQVDQGSQDPIIEFKRGTTQIGKFDQDGYLYATGFKTSGTTGFLKSDGSVDTGTYVTTTGYNNSNWDTAFGWGNHAGLYDSLGDADAVQDNLDSLVGSLGSAAYTASTAYAAASHTHSYLPLSGGTVTGETTFDSLVSFKGHIKLYDGTYTGDWGGIESKQRSANSHDMIVYVADDGGTGDRIKLVSRHYSAGDTDLAIFDATFAEINTRLKLNTVDANTTSTTALVLNGAEIEKRTLGSAAFTDSTAYAAASHTHSYLPLSGGTLTGGVSGTTATFSGLVTANSGLIVDNIATHSTNVLVGYDDGGSNTKRYKFLDVSYNTYHWVAMSPIIIEVFQRDFTGSEYAKYLLQIGYIDSGGSQDGSGNGVQDYRLVLLESSTGSGDSNNHRIFVGTPTDTGLDGSDYDIYSLPVYLDAWYYCDYTVKITLNAGAISRVSSFSNTGQYIFTEAPTASTYAGVPADLPSSYHAMYGVLYGDPLVQDKSTTDRISTIKNYYVNPAGDSVLSGALQVGNPNAAGNGITIAAQYSLSEAYLRFRSGHPNNSNIWETANISATDDGNYNGRIHFRTSTSGQAAPSIKMTIKADGKVGINTTSPSRRLHVSAGDANPAARFENTSSNDTVLELYSSGDARYMYFQTDHIYVNSGSMHFGNETGDIYLRTSSGGKVGIGTTSPVASLDVKGVSDTSGAISLQLRSGNTSSNFDSNQITLSYNNTALYRHAIKTRHNSGSSSGNAIDFYTWQYGGLDSAIGGQHVMSLDGANVGVGITSPTATLHVVGTHKHFANTGAGTNLVRVDQYGTDTNYRLDYKQIVSSGLVKHSYNVVNGGTGYDNNLVLDRGNVGIGTASPTEKLEVAGNIKTSGSIALNNGNITGVNQLEINDPGEGIVWKNGASGDIVLAVVDDASDNILRLSGTNASMQIGTDTVATQAYVSTAIANLVDQAPQALDTLSELAAALGDDAAFSTTVSTALGNRLRIDTNAQNLTATEKSNVFTNLDLANNFLPLSGVAVTVNGTDYAPGDELGAADLLAVIKTVDGSTSGLDADTLDGIDSGSFLRSDANDTYTGTLTVSGTVALGELRMGTHPYHTAYTGLWNTEASTTTTEQYMIISAGTDTYINGDSVYIRAGNNSTSNQLRVTTTGVTVGGNKVLTESADLTTYNIAPAANTTYDLGRDTGRWRIVYCETLDSAGIHEANLANKKTGLYATGTVLVWKDGQAIPSTSFADYMKIGIAVYGNSSPLVHGAEPVLCTGQVEEGDYLVTSTETGHAMALTRQEVRERNLMDCVIGKALESGDGKSHLIKTWLTI